MKSLKILIIDDSESMRFIIQEILSNNDHEVLTACSGEEGLLILKQHSDIDLILTDRRMPGGMLGEEVVRRAKLMRPELKIVLMSSDDPQEILPVAKAAGADKFLDKNNLFAETSRLIGEFFPASLPP